MTKKVHFMGIGGSGCAGCAAMALEAGFEVSGCDINLETPYLEQIKDKDIELYQGHDKKHLEGKDIVACSPALFSRDIEEVNEAKKAGILMKWQHFLGDFIMKDKKVIAVCGTHGKTTTTSMLGTCLEEADEDPSVFVGGVVSKWNQTIRIGKSDLFVIEADEYDSNFIKYAPDIVLLNNAEMEHPEIFKDEATYIKIFEDFLRTIQKNGSIIVNLDCPGCLQLIEDVQDYIAENEIKIYGYSTVGESRYSCEKNYDGLIISNENGKRTFEIDGHIIKMNLPGEHNVANAMSVIACADILGSDMNKVIKGLETFTATQRRMEVVKEYENGTIVINDYAHHHTQVLNTLKTAREINDNNSLVAVFEAHQISRLQNHMQEYADALRLADKIYITPIFVGREAGKALPNMDKFLEMIDHDHAKFIDECPTCVAGIVKAETKDTPSTIVVMGAGKSHLIAKEL